MVQNQLICLVPVKHMGIMEQTSRLFQFHKTTDMTVNLHKFPETRSGFLHITKWPLPVKEALLLAGLATGMSMYRSTRSRKHQPCATIQRRTPLRLAVSVY